MEVNLVRVKKNGSSQSIPLSHDRTLIGRLDSCHIRVPVAGMSRKHCEIVIEGGSITVNDLGSSNGTYINQDRIKSQPVSAGDLISFGGMVFVIQVNNEPEQLFPEMMFEDGLPIADEPAAPAVQQAPGKSQSSVKQASAAKTGGSLDDELDLSSMDNDESSMMDFEFDFDDDDEQPPL